MFENTYYKNYTGLCGDNNILLKNNNENIKLNIEYYYSTDKLIVKKVPDSFTDECHWHKGMYSYKYDIVKIDNNKGTNEILNSCKIFFDYNTNCNKTTNDKNDNDDYNDDDNDDLDIFVANSSKGLNNLFLLLFAILNFLQW